MALVLLCVHTCLRKILQPSRLPQQPSQILPDHAGSCEINNYLLLACKDSSGIPLCRILPDQETVMGY
eukprot:scaffold18570_cov89-Cylindrotheca_fusiformis.AAC.3